MERTIVCVGNVVQDEVFHVEELPRSGIKTGVLGYERRFGGPAATAAVAIVRLGGRAAYRGRVGADEAGRAALAALRGHGVDCAGVAVLPEGRTLRAIVIVDRGGERAIISDRRSLAQDPSALPAEPLDGAGVVLVDSRWPAGGTVMLERAAAAGIASVFDADGGAAGDLQPLIDRADHVVFSSEGLRDHAGDGDAGTLLRRCASAAGGAGGSGGARVPGCATAPGRVFAVTRGTGGSLWLIDGELHAVPAFAVDVADTTGCGDVFHGAYALGLCEGLPPLQAARFASAAAAVKAERGRGWDGMADRAAVERLLGGRAPGEQPQTR